MLGFATLSGSAMLCAHHRHLLMDQCTNENIGSTSDVLFSSNLKDTQCIDEDFNYNLNAPKVGKIIVASGDRIECRNDDYFVRFGHCQHFPNGLRRRSMTYEVLDGRICIKPRLLVQKNSTYMVPCDCTLEDLRDLSVPIGLGRCQRIIYIKSDPDCSSLGSFPPYNSTYLCPGARRAAKEILFMSDWVNVQARTVHATGITVLQSTTSCEPLRCLENERPESGSFDRYIFRDCAMRNSHQVQNPVLAFRWSTDGPLADQDRLTVSINGIESYSWTADHDDHASLPEIPMPAIRLGAGIVNVSWKFIRPFCEDCKTVDSVIITLERWSSRRKPHLQNHSFAIPVSKDYPARWSPSWLSPGIAAHILLQKTHTDTDC
ncbi:hypothetical protein PSACC_03686 [Paramicrosporidium saccamoebae]|uniref:Uncharacterized protein n=1 Tax=Paramicrosporidium saccamoebae TaxID=1246581 RepID=A0A2H9TFE1_9FUNG|nr:hypothetical protein PSACC_03686 [Paramicrosporidium saccamoebae]